MGTHPIFESDFDCLTDDHDKRHRRRLRAGRPCAPSVCRWAHSMCQSALEKNGNTLVQSLGKYNRPLSTVVTDHRCPSRHRIGSTCIALCAEKDLLAPLHRRPPYPGLLGAVGNLVLLVRDASIDNTVLMVRR